MDEDIEVEVLRGRGCTRISQGSTPRLCTEELRALREVLSSVMQPSVGHCKGELLSLYASERALVLILPVEFHSVYAVRICPLFSAAGY